MKTKSKPKKSLLIQGVPENVKTSFKAACAQNNESMREALINFMVMYALLETEK